MVSKHLVIGIVHNIYSYFSLAPFKIKSQSANRTLKYFQKEIFWFICVLHMDNNAMGLEFVPENVHMRTCCILYSARYNMLYLPDWQGFILANHSSWLKGYFFKNYFIKPWINLCITGQSLTNTDGECTVLRGLSYNLLVVVSSYPLNIILSFLKRFALNLLCCVFFHLGNMSYVYGNSIRWQLLVHTKVTGHIMDTGGA